MLTLGSSLQVGLLEGSDAKGLLSACVSYLLWGLLGRSVSSVPTECHLPPLISCLVWGLMAT